MTKGNFEQWQTSNRAAGLVCEAILTKPKKASCRLAWCIALASLLAAMVFPLPAQQVITGELGLPLFRGVINFRGLEEFEKSLGTQPLVTKTNEAPMPLRALTNQPPSGAGFQAAGNPGFSAASAPLPPSPAAASSFQALADNLTSFPPDTHGAAGPNHLMTVHNTQVRIQNKTGAIISTVNLITFWQTLGVSDVFDPKVLYDPYAGRWMFTAVAQRRSAQSSVLMAVSQTSDPTGNWFLFRVDADRNNQDWADYPSMGFNKDWIVVSLNMFPIFQNAVGFSAVNLFVFNKTNLYANGTGQFTLLRDASTIGFTMCPTMTYDNSLSTMHLVEVDNLINNFSGESSRLRLSTITGPVGAEVLTMGSGFTTNVSQWASSDPYFGGIAQQLDGFFGIANNDSRIQNVVYRNGSLWCAHTVMLPAGIPTHSAVQWWQLAPSGTSLQFGRIEDVAGQTSYAFPSIAVNRNEDVLIGFSRFSPLEYASAAYAFRSCADPLNVFRTDTVLKAGEAKYEKLGGFRNRWGDYSSTVVDPVNDYEMWTIQEYATTPTNFANFGLIDRWATWWGRIVPADTCYRIEFVTREYSVSEDSPPGFASISVLNLGGGAGTVDFQTSPGTAIAGTDYEERNGRLTFAPGQTETNFIVRILDNAAMNSNKTVNLTLSNPTGPASLGRITNAVLTIIDDETQIVASQAGEFVFSSYINGGFSYLASENETFIYSGIGCSAGQLYTFRAPEREVPGVLVTVVRTNGNRGRVMVDYETAEGGGAIPFLDYTPVSGTLVFDDYQMSTNIMVEVFENSFFVTTNNVGTGLRFIRLVLSNPRPAPEDHR